MTNRTICALLACGTLATAPAAAAQEWGHGPRPDAGACFYEYPNFGGRYFCVRAGEDYPFIPNGMNDRISSIRVFGGGQAVVYSFPRFGGAERWFNYDARDLRYDGWDDRISSVRVGRHAERDRWDDRFFEERRDRDYREGPPPESRDYREGPPRGTGGRQAITPDAVRAMVTKAYQDLLNRAPDPGGLQQYSDKMLKEGWTDQQVRESIMQSPEYRQKHQGR
jgi:hypothetical protein